MFIVIINHITIHKIKIINIIILTTFDLSLICWYKKIILFYLLVIYSGCSHCRTAITVWKNVIFLFRWIEKLLRLCISFLRNWLLDLILGLDIFRGLYSMMWLHIVHTWLFGNYIVLLCSFCSNCKFLCSLLSFFTFFTSHSFLWCFIRIIDFFLLDVLLLLNN